MGILERRAVMLAIATCSMGLALTLASLVYVACEGGWRKSAQLEQREVNER